MDDLDVAVADAAGMGGRILREPAHQPTGRNVTMSYSNGAVVEYVEWSATTRAQVGVSLWVFVVGEIEDHLVRSVTEKDCGAGNTRQQLGGRNCTPGEERSIRDRDPRLATVIVDYPTEDEVGMTRQVADRLLAERTIGLPSSAPATSTVRFMVEDGLPVAKEHNRRQQGTGAIRCALRGLPIERAYRPVDTPQLGCSVSLRVFIEREGEGS